MLKLVHDGSDSTANGVGALGSSLLDEIVCDGACQMLAAALQAEVAAYIESCGHEVDEDGHRLVSATGTTPAGK